MRPTTTLVVVKMVHTVVWAFFAACILAIPAVALANRRRLAAVLTVLVLFEVTVLVANGWRCPLTGVAARYTDDRSDNFDIYLPRWLARYNKQVFGTLFVVGEAVALWSWLR